MFLAYYVASLRVQFLALLFSQYTHDLLVSLQDGLEVAITCMLMTHSCTCRLILAMNQKFPHLCRICNTVLLTLGYG